MLWFTLLLLMGVLGAGNAATNYECDRNGSPVGKIIGYQGKCYELITDRKLTYNDASYQCRKYGGFLVSVTSEKIEKVLRVYLIDKAEDVSSVWIGLHDKDDEGEFVWEDGSSSSYTHWKSGLSPFSLVTDCVAMDNNGRWRDYRCKRSGFLLPLVRGPKFPFICQYKATEIIKTHPTTVDIGVKTSTVKVVETTTIKATLNTDEQDLFEVTDDDSTTSITPVEAVDDDNKASVDIPGHEEDETDLVTTKATITASRSDRTRKKECGEPGCPGDLDCGLRGLKSDEDGCVICECIGS